MRRFAFNFVSGASALLFALVMAAWIRSYLATDVIQYRAPQAEWEFGIAWGKGYIAGGIDGVVDWNETGLQINSTTPRRIDGSWHKASHPYLVIDLIFVRFVNYTGTIAIYTKAWLPAVLFAILPAISLKRYFRARTLAHRAAAGLCLHCGYDMRQSSDRCPECGAVADAIDLQAINPASHW